MMYSFTREQWWKFIVVVFLMLMNWGLEAYKWQWLMKGVQSISFAKAYKAIFAGQAFAFGTVNNIGEFIGKVAFLDEGNRWRAISLSVVGSISQVIVTFVMGIAGLMCMRSNFVNSHLFKNTFNNIEFNGLLVLLMIVLMILLLLYYQLGWVCKLLERLPMVGKDVYLIEQLDTLHKKELTRILCISLIRFVVFVCQYLLLLQVFKVEANTIDIVWMVCIMFLILAIIPSIAFAELGLRGEIGILLLGLLSTNIAGILLATTGIWFINRVLPAFTGSVFLIRLKLFKQ